jgi:PAS domain S-box-containing protein
MTRTTDLTEAALNRFRGELISQMREAVIATDNNGYLTYLNHAAEELYGCTASTVLGSPAETLYCELTAPAGAARRPGATRRLHRRADGRELQVEFSEMPMRDSNGNGVGSAAVIREVSEQVRAESALLDADRRKEEFLATLAHELRNPLFPIKNGLALLRHGLNARQGDTVAMIERQLAQLVNLLDDLLDVSRISHGKVELRLERVGIAQITEAAVEACRAGLAARRNDLRIASLADVFVLGDRTRLIQIIVNLISNAAKYSKAGTEINLSWTIENRLAVLTIGDQGVGIAADVLPTLWSMFNQVRDTIDKAQAGLGIGLALVKQLVLLHGGSVDAHSEGLGRGSVFTVRLPLVGPESWVISNVAAVSADARPANQARILVVDDNVDGADSLAMLLRLSGHEAVVEHDGPRSLERLQTFVPTVVILDIGLPGMDGYQVARAMRAHPNAATAVLVAVTGWSSDEDRRKTREAGFDYHYAKPVDIQALEALLQSPTRRISADREIR